MKKILSFLVFLLISIGMWGAESLYKETAFNSINNSASIQNYTSTWYNTTNGFRVDITNANNNQNGWNYIKFGRKNNASTGTIITNATIDKKITKVGITIDALTTAKITSITLYKSTNKSSWTSLGTFTKSTGTQNVTISDANQAVNLYYKIEFVCQSGSSNGLIQISHVYFYIDEEVTPCDSVTISLTTPVHGTASLSKSKVCPGEEIEISYTPDTGYELDKILAGENEIGTTLTVTQDTTVTVLFKEIPPAPNIDVVEWNPDWLKIDIENFTAATAVLEDLNTLADIKLKFATELFFSKYFEAGGKNKMLAIYNGTKDTLDLNNYTFKLSNVTAAAVALGNYGNYDSHYILPNTEILFVHYDSKNSAKNCADDIEGYQNWIEAPDNGSLGSHMDFGGRTSLGLYKNGTLIDVIGMHLNGTLLAISTSNVTCSLAKISGYNDGEGFYTYNGDNIKTEEIENDYFLSTNRCMLVRKNIVKSGANAVAKNVYPGGNALCNDTVALLFRTLAEEWMGYQIGNGNNSQALTDSTCTGLAYAGHYDYNDYYVAFDTVYTERPIPGKEDDGYYKIDIPQLDTLSCTNLKITVKDNNSNELLEIVKIPIMIKTEAFTDDATYFTKKDCDKCDVVVLKDQTLKTRGTRVNRDVKLYEGAELRVNEATTYTINSLAFRRYNDSVSSLKLDGTLNVNKVYFDLLITPDAWHYISLPDTFIVSNVKYVNGKTPKYGEDCLARWYNGEYRALYQGGGWKNVVSGMKFNPGNGFIFGLSDEFKKKEFRFELSPDILTYERTNRTVANLHAWGVTKSDDELRPNHKGWNLIGTPFMSYMTAEIYDKIRVDSLVKVMDGNKWTGQWELSGTTRGRSLRYAVIPSDAPADRDAGGYKSVVLDNMKLSPFTCFFVQLGGNSEAALGIEFKASRQVNRIVAKSQEYDDDEIFLRIKVDDWKTGCFISREFSERYEPGDDLESRYPIYLNLGGYKLLYSAVNDSIIENGILINTPDGHLMLDPKVNVNEFEYVYVLYNDEWYNLLYDELDVSGQFTLYAKRKQVTTDIQIIPTNGIYKFTDGKNVYINKNNKIYNIIGNLYK